ncbi:MAG TPA: ABC transporter permease, partial [Candidatus Limnocylindrales bacterium]|nr:ABC transporter permease [Candidatus Limnocylindrales bacterium]
MIAQLRTDLADVVRTLRRSPKFTAVATLTLGLGVGSATAVFSIANQLLLRPIPGVADADGAAYLEFRSSERPSVGLSGPDFEALRREATLLEGLASYDNVSFHASTGSTRPVDVQAYTVYGDYFEILGVQPLVGRLLTARESGVAADPFVAVISEELWERLFARSPDVVGRPFEARGRRYTIVGVAGGGFRGTDRSWPVDAWLPRSAFGSLEGYPVERLASRESRLNQWFLARPRPGVSLVTAEAEVDALLARLVEDVGEASDYLADVRAALQGGVLPTAVRDRLERTLGVLGGAAALLLLITCANVANLLLLRGLERRGDTAVRRAFGASAGRVVRWRLLEALVVAALGTVTGLAVATQVSRLFEGFSLWGMPGLEGVSLDPRIVAFSAVAVLLTALLAGALPAAVGTRSGPAEALRDAGRPSTVRNAALRGAMSALQIALSLTLLTGSLLLVRTVRNLHSVDAGLGIEGVTALTFDMERDLPEITALDARHRDLLAAVRAVPGVEAAALHGWYGPYRGMLSTRIALPGAPDATAETGVHWVTPGWFHTFEVRPLRGRTFDERDWRAASPLPVVMTAPLAERLFGHVDVVGRRARLGQRGRIDDVEIVGVVGELRTVDLRQPPDEAVFLPHTTERALLATLTVVFRASDGAAAAEVRRAVESVVPHLPIPEPAPLADRIDA